MTRPYFAQGRCRCTLDSASLTARDSPALIVVWLKETNSTHLVEEAK